MAERVLELVSYSLSLLRKGQTVSILSNLSFHLEKGEILGLVGPSGSGKSMTFTAISRLLQQLTPIEESGQIILHQENNSVVLNETDNVKPYLKNKMGIVFQQSSEMLNPRQTIATQLYEKLASQNTVVLEELLESVGLTPPEIYKEAYPFNLSGGQLQRVLIALAIANKPTVVLADEPFSAVDANLKEELSQLLLRLVREQGVSLLLVSHDQELIDSIADRVLHIDNGELIDGKLTAEPLPIAIPSKVSDEVILSVDNLSKSYSRGGLFASSSGNKVLDGLGLHLQRGDILGIQGPSGVGKSTLARVLAGMESYQEGTIHYKGQNIADLDKVARSEYFRLVQLIPQDPLSRMPPHRTVKAHFEDVFYVKNIPYDTARVADIMDVMHLDPVLLSRLPKALSGGQRQRVLIAKALLMEAELLICDEIFSALDYDVQTEIGTLLKRLSTHKSLSIIMISHDLAVVDKYCDRLVQM